MIKPQILDNKFKKAPGLYEGRDLKGHREDRPCTWAGEGHTEQVLSQCLWNVGVKTSYSDSKVHLKNGPNENSLENVMKGEQWEHNGRIRQGELSTDADADTEHREPETGRGIHENVVCDSALQIDVGLRLINYLESYEVKSLFHFIHENKLEMK